MRRHLSEHILEHEAGRGPLPALQRPVRRGFGLGAGDDLLDLLL